MDGREKISTKQNAVSNGVVREAVKVDHGCPKSMGSRLARLETVEEMDGLEMETEGREDSEMDADISGAHINKGVATAKGKQVESSTIPTGTGISVVLRASHPELIEGSKTVNAKRSPNGQGAASGKKERALRDLTNNMDGGLSIPKPIHNGPHSGVGSAKEKVVDLVGGASRSWGAS